jgi:two-component system, NarL family, response regulator DesR
VVAERAPAELATVVLIEDQVLLADALVAALPGQAPVRVVAVAATLADGIDAIRTHQPDVVLSDFRLPDGDVTGALGTMASAAPGVRVLVYTGWADEAGLLGVLAAGAAGYVEKSSSVEQLADAVRRVLAGETVVAPRLVPLLTKRAIAVRSAQELTVRELQVLELLAAGRSTSEIAAELFLSPNTVRNKVSAVLAKLDARSRLDAVRIGVARGLVRYDPPVP